MKKINYCFKKKSLLHRLFSLGLGVLLTISLFPISIHADTITTDNIVGVSAVVSDSLVNGQVTFNSQTFNVFRVNYDIEVIFDQAYLGYVQLTLEYDYYTRDSTGVISRTENQTRRVFVNGTSAHINLNIFSSYNNAPLLATYNNPRVSTITTGGTNVTPIGDLSDLQQIVEILQDIYSLEGDIEGLENNQILQLQRVVANTSLANNYLETISKLKQFNIPFESLSMSIVPLQFYEIKSFYNNSYWSFPLFSLPANGLIFRKYLEANRHFYIIIATSTNIYDNSTFGSSFSYGDLVIDSIKTLYSISSGFNVTKIELHSLTSGNFDIRSNLSMDYIGFYFGYYNNKYLSTDFALQFDLTNKILDDLDIIANGTSRSSSSSNNLDDTTSQFQTDANSLISIEDNFNSSMNNNLDNINPTFYMGSSFLASANWVSTQFNRIVNNTPFSSLITFGLTLGLGLLIIGKIRK